MVIWLVLPDFWAGIVRCSCLCLKEASPLSDFADVEVTKLENARLGEEQVCTLDVSVDDLAVMQGLQPTEHLYEIRPARGLRNL